MLYSIEMAQDVAARSRQVHPGCRLCITGPGDPQLGGPACAQADMDRQKLARDMAAADGALIGAGLAVLAELDPRADGVGVRSRHVELKEGRMTCGADIAPQFERGAAVHHHKIEPAIPVEIGECSAAGAIGRLRSRPPGRFR